MNKAMYAGKLIGRMEAQAEEAGGLASQIMKLAHRLKDLRHDATHSAGQLAEHVNLTDERSIGVKSTVRAIEGHATVADRVLGSGGSHD